MTELNGALIAICTHNPSLTLLQSVARALRNTESPARFLIVDSGSTNGFPKSVAIENNFEYIRIKSPGTARARFAALENLRDDELLIFIDDDNVVDHDYVENALNISKMNPSWGAFAGELLLPKDYKVHRRFVPFLKFLAIKNLGNMPLSMPATLFWTELEPPGAGVCIRPEVAKSLVTKVKQGDTRFFKVGAVGNKQLRGEDSFIARQCFYLGLEWGYHPDLKLFHFFNQKRMSFNYISRLLFNLGYSDVFLDDGLDVEPSYPYPESLAQVIHMTFHSGRKSLSGLVNAIRFTGQYFGYKKLMKLKRL